MASGGEGKVLKGFHYYVYYYLVTQWVSFVALFWFLVGDERTMTEAIYKYIADELFHIRFRAHPKTQSLYRPKNGGHTVYLCNHRSFADFFIDGYLTCDAAYIGRMMAIVACPFAGIVGWYRDKAYFFNRGQGCNKGKLYEAMKQLLDRGNNILLYPTGTRNQTLQRQELRWGMIRWAYRESIPVQFVICSNKDRVISEKKIRSATQSALCRLQLQGYFARKVLNYRRVLCCRQHIMDRGMGPSV